MSWPVGGPVCRASSGGVGARQPLELTVSAVRPCRRVFMPMYSAQETARTEASRAPPTRRERVSSSSRTKGSSPRHDRPFPRAPRRRRSSRACRGRAAARSYKATRVAHEPASAQGQRDSCPCPLLDALSPSLPRDAGPPFVRSVAVLPKRLLRRRFTRCFEHPTGRGVASQDLRTCRRPHRPPAPG